MTYKSMKTPYLRRFAEALPKAGMPLLRVDPHTQTTETLQEGGWVPSLASASFAGQQTTKTAVESESTDYR